MREKFTPAQIAPGVQFVNLDALWEKGIRGIVLDVDNTLCVWKWGEAEVPAPVTDWVRKAEARGFRLCIISNGRPPRIAGVAAALGVPFVAPAGKPLKSGFRRALRLLGTSPDTTAAIGDQLLTDVLGANRMGLHAILVPPLSPREFPGTKLNRLLERVLRRHLGLPEAGP